MNNKCRFCRKKGLRLLFASNKDADAMKKVEDYACTNSAFGIHGPIVKCPSCQIIYVDEKLTQEQISTYYEVANDPLYFAEQEARRMTFQKYLKKLRSLFPKKGRLLDVGTNTGLFVKIAMNDGWDAVGLEPNKWGVNYARKEYGLTLINKPFESGTFKKESFDVVTMWDVIEHFTNPVWEMVKVFGIIKPGGVFAFSTVDPDSLLAKTMGSKWPWYMEMHKVFFDKAAADSYLKRVGFRTVTFTPHFRNLSLGYLASRLEAINPTLSKLAAGLISKLRLSKVIVPYYANDLYDCYAIKK